MPAQLNAVCPQHLRRPPFCFLPTQKLRQVKNAWQRKTLIHSIHPSRWIYSKAIPAGAMMFSVFDSMSTFSLVTIVQQSTAINKTQVAHWKDSNSPGEKGRRDCSHYCLFRQGKFKFQATSSHYWCSWEPPSLYLGRDGHQIFGLRMTDLYRGQAMPVF